MHHIRATLPDIKVRISEQQKKYAAELQSLGGLVADNSVRHIRAFTAL
jgi:vacuolar protein sorting-associated protein 1